MESQSPLWIWGTYSREHQIIVPETTEHICSRVQKPLWYYFIFTDPRIGNLHSKNVKEHIANYSFPSTQVAHWLRIHLPSRRCRLDPWVRKIPWRREWQPFPVFLPGKSHGQRSLVSSSLWGHKKNRTWLGTKQQVDSVIKAASPLLLSPGWCHQLVNGTIS